MSYGTPTLERPQTTETLAGYVPDLTTYDFILINTSGGKDSQTAMRRTVELADAQGVSRDRLVAVHADLGTMEWKGVRELAQEQAEAYGLEFQVVRYCSKAGQEKDILDYVEDRGMWPSNTARFCTSEFKRGPCNRIITVLARRAKAAGSAKPQILNVFGFRAQESSARAKRQEFSTNDRASSGARTVHDWLPIHGWSESQVWADIKASGIRHHEAYDLGMPRLSCAFCIFAPKGALLIAGRANPELLDRYVEVEKRIGHEFRQGQPISAIKDAIEAGETAKVEGAWNM